MRKSHSRTAVAWRGHRRGSAEPAPRQNESGSKVERRQKSTFGRGPEEGGKRWGSGILPTVPRRGQHGEGSGRAAMSTVSMRTFGSFSKTRAPGSTLTETYSTVQPSPGEASAQGQGPQQTSMRSLEQPIFQEIATRVVRVPPALDLQRQCLAWLLTCTPDSFPSPTLSWEKLRPCGLIRPHNRPGRTTVRFLKHYTATGDARLSPAALAQDVQQVRTNALAPASPPRQWCMRDTLEGWRTKGARKAGEVA